MAKVYLRVYNREIETLIDQGHLDEAIAHCRHILRVFSKYLETYRLLGKAYLEAKRYDEAVDVFSRVLMAVPDDFVSHVGMSIIRDDQNKLDDAIWHMERAFETQPSNAAIQAELQRLFGRRDGTQPPKIRMTRGALAHMYIQGELYLQAISEIKAVLAQDNERDDMKVLLARAYFHSGQKADASDICSQLLNRYAYSFDANRIMLELLQGSDSADNVQVYRQRVHELDPYAAYADGTVFQSNEVSDAAVGLERLEYRGQELEPGIDWSAAGIGAAATAAVQEPEWLSAGLTPAAPEEPVAPADTGSDIPDFMRQAGWREASGALEGPSAPEPEPGIANEEELTPAEMPGWLKAMAPAESGASAPDVSASDVPEWLSGLRSESQTTAGEDEIPAWLKGLDETEAEAAPASDESDLPAWLRSTAETTPIEPEGIAEPDLGVLEPFAGLTPLAPEASAEADLFESEIFGELTPIEPETSVVEPETHAAETLLEAEVPAEPSFVELEAMGELTPIEPEPFVEPIPPEPEAALLWPEAAGEPGPIEPAALEPARTADESLPQEPEIEAPVAGSVTPLPSLATLGMSAQEQDDAMAWLESLAAKHGARSEELVTDPGARSEKPPAWVEQARALSEAQVDEPAGEAPALAEGFAAETPIAPELPVSELQAPAEEFPVEAPVAAEAAVSGMAELVEEPAPEALSAAEELVSEVHVPAQEPELSGSSADETSLWLRELTEKVAPVEEPEESLFAAESTEAEFAEPVTDMPEWLNKLDAAARTAEETQPIAPIQAQNADAEVSELPDWLRGLDEEQQWPATASVGDELPAWLQGEPEPPAQTEPTAPTDWRPVEAGKEPQPAQESRPEPELVPPPLGALEQVSGLEAEPPREYEPEPEQIVHRQPAPPASKKAPVRPAAGRQAGVLAPVSDPELAAARSEMKRGDIPSALEHYGRLIKKGRWLEEIIRDLREALYRYPVEITIWQTLGDAYMRENRLQEALDAYTKAEELLR